MLLPSPSGKRERDLLRSPTVDTLDHFLGEGDPGPALPAHLMLSGYLPQLGSCCSTLVQQCSFQGAAQGAGHSCVLCHLDGRYSSITCSATTSISHCCAGASQLVSTTATPSPRSLNALLPQMSSGFCCLLASPRNSVSCRLLWGPSSSVPAVKALPQPRYAALR